MILFRLGQAAELLGVSADTVRRWADSGRLPTRRTTGGQRVVEGPALAALAVSLAEEGSVARGARESARNHFAGLVTKVTKDSVMAQVDLQAGPHRVVSLMSREAADDLGLEPGMLAVAVIKATSVVVQLPPRAGGMAVDSVDPSE
ncbi:MAG: TOBE domain-containing protein [Candidatus Dormiibacterota bacterium]